MFEFSWNLCSVLLVNSSFSFDSAELKRGILQASLSLNLMQDQVDEVRLAYDDRCSVSTIHQGYPY